MTGMVLLYGIEGNGVEGAGVGLLEGSEGWQGRGGMG